MSSSIYSEVLLESYRNPTHKGKIAKPTLSASDVNVACGDEIEVQLKIDKSGKISEVKFNAKGCIVSQAAMEMLAEHVEGKTLQEVKEMKEQDALGLLGIKLTPIRMKCGLLGFNALKKAFNERD